MGADWADLMGGVQWPTICFNLLMYPALL
jgi:hypothetical protein